MFPFIPDLVERGYGLVTAKILEEIKAMHEAYEELMCLGKELERINDVLNEASNRAVEEERVKNWLKDLEAAAYEMENIFDVWNYVELDYDKSSKQVCLSIHMSSLFFKSILQKKLCVKLLVQKQIKCLRREEDQIFNFVLSLPRTNQKASILQTNSFVDVERLLHRRVVSDLERMVNFVLSLPRTNQKASILQTNSFVDVERFLHRRVVSDLERMVGGSGGVRKVCVVGIGGIGKTTLAQIVYNKLKVAVDVGIWISVNQPFSLASVCRDIAQKFCDAIFLNTDQFDYILDWLSMLVKEKSFFLVLDDVWTERSEDLDP